MKLLANEHISIKTIEALKVLGHDISPIPKKGADDIDVLEKAKQDSAIIITQDLDYSALLAQNKDVAPSVISLRLEYPDPQCVTQILVSVLKTHQKALQSGVILSINDGGLVRVKKLPFP